MILTITVTPKAELDAYGDRPEPGPSREVCDCYVAPATTREIDGNGREGVETALNLYAPSGTAIGPHETVTVPGHGTFEVDGTGFDWVNPLTTWRAGATFRLKRVAG